MRYSSVLAVISAFLLLVAVAPPALAGSAVTAKGRAYGATRLGLAVQLPNGQRSTVTFTLRESSGAKLVGYAVGSTRYYEKFNFGDYNRVGRSAAYWVFKSAAGSAYHPRARLVYKRVHRSGRTYRILVSIRYVIVGE